MINDLFCFVVFGILIILESEVYLINIIGVSFSFFIQEKQVDLLPMLKNNVSTPEGVPRLFDLVKVQDERMKLAFFAALRNTVVAKDLDQVSSTFLAENSFLMIDIQDH